MNSVSIQSSPGLTLSETRCSKPPSTVRGSSAMTRSAQASAARFSAGSRVRPCSSARASIGAVVLTLRAGSGCASCLAYQPSSSAS